MPVLKSILLHCQWQHMSQKSCVQFLYIDIFTQDWKLHLSGLPSWSLVFDSPSEAKLVVCYLCRARREIQTKLSWYVNDCNCRTPFFTFWSRSDTYLCVNDFLFGPHLIERITSSTPLEYTTKKDATTNSQMCKAWKKKNSSLSNNNGGIMSSCKYKQLTFVIAVEQHAQCFWVTVSCCPAHKHALYSPQMHRHWNISTVVMLPIRLYAAIWACSDHTVIGMFPVLICVHCCQTVFLWSCTSYLYVFDIATCSCFAIPSISIFPFSCGSPCSFCILCKPHFIHLRGSSEWQGYLVTQATGRKWEKVQLIYRATHYVLK